MPAILSLLSFGADPALANPSASFHGEKALVHAKRMLEVGQRHYGAKQRPAAIAQLVDALDRYVDDIGQQRFTARESRTGQEHALVNIIGRRPSDCFFPIQNSTAMRTLPPLVLTP